jgi:hypothetical protein
LCSAWIAWRPHCYAGFRGGTERPARGSDSCCAPAHFGDNRPEYTGCDRTDVLYQSSAEATWKSRLKTDELDPPSMALVECLKKTSCSPVTQTEPTASEMRPRFEKNTCDALFLQTPSDASAAAQNPAGNSGSSMTCGIHNSHELKVTVRQTLLAQSSSETLIDIAAIRLMLNHISPG